MSMQSIQKELRNLKQEEMTLINLATKFSDQLNRLKVEELALQNLVRIQNEEQERTLRGTGRSFLSSDTLTSMNHDSELESDLEEIELDLTVTNSMRNEKLGAEDVEEEEEEDEENKNRNEVQDIEQFVEQLS